MKLGIMGGTFNPIHIGHLVAAEEARGSFGLERVVFMPAGRHPHSKAIPGGATAEHRYEMTVIATADNDRFSVSRFEIDRRETSYTVDTVRHFLEESPGADVFFITGADAILEILEWKDPDELLGMATLIAVPRPGYPLDRLSETTGRLRRGERIRIMEAPAIGVSSSLIRERVAAGMSIRYLVPEGVERFIEKEKLYRQA